MMNKNTGIYFRVETSDGKVRILNEPEAFTFITSINNTSITHRISSKHELGFKHYIL